jgi:hypothetical protein
MAYTITLKILLFFPDLNELPYTIPKWTILISVLMTKAYIAPSKFKWKDKTRILGETFPILQNTSTADENNVVKELVESDKVLRYQGATVGFISDDVRHQVMSYFVLKCLHTDKDYENYIRLSSVDSLLEYVRTWFYERETYERCLYLPESVRNIFIDKIGLLALNHQVTRTFGDRNLLQCRKLLFVLYILCSFI